MATRILIVDDNKFPRKALRKVLPADVEFEVSEASNGIEALDHILDNVPDLVFLDLTMPDMDGYELLDRLRKKNIKVNVVVVSADIQERAVQRVKELGAIDFIQKPISTDDMTRVLASLGIL